MKIIITALSCLAFTVSQGQLNYEKRVEFPLSDGYQEEIIHNFGENGIVLQSKSKKKTDGETEWKFEKLDKDLQNVGTLSLMISKKLYENETFTGEEREHIFFTGKDDYSLVTIDSESLKETTVSGLLPKKARVYDMAVLEEYAYFSASIKKAPFLFHINWQTGEQKLIPIQIEGLKPKQVEIKSFQFLEESKEILAFLRVDNKKEPSDIYVAILDETGTKRELFNLTGSTPTHLVNITGTKVGDNNYIFTGTYSPDGSGHSEGLFFARWDDGKVSPFKLYNFYDLDNFLSGMGKKDKAKLDKKKRKKEAKGKELKLNYYIKGHEVIKLDEENFLYIGEAYYPTYRTETYTTTSTVNGHRTTTTHTRQVFDGYQYSHAVLARFDAQGEKEWDKTFEMWPSYKPMVVKRFISVSDISDGVVNLAFASHNKIVSKSFDENGDVVVDKTSSEIETGNEGDKTLRSFSNLDYWYGKTFLAYGSQIIKNKEDEEVKGRRKVFFLTKISFE